MLTVTKWVDVITKRVDIPARVLISLLFLISGIGKLTGATATQGFMEAYGVPGILVWPAAAWEISAGILLLAGLKVRTLSLLLAGWCLLTASIFHTAWADPDQTVHFLKNMTMAGGFLMLAKSGSWAASVDALLASRGETAAMEPKTAGRKIVATT